MNNESIFLIDDDPVTNMINKKIIEKNSSFKVISFTNAGVALDQLNQRSVSEGSEFPRFIFLDINMSPMDGWEFLEEFQKFPDILLIKCGVIILTSSFDLYDIEKSKMNKSVREFISKPLTSDKLKVLPLT